MKLELDVQGAGGSGPIPIRYDDIERVEQLVARIDEHGVDGASVLAMALESEATLEPSRSIQGLNFKHTVIEVHRVCVQVHFESEHQRHYFPVNARWARVHRWGCRRFSIAHDACANLELHMGAPDGPVVNERKPIRTSDECLVVWLVKPGPEPNGTNDGSQQ